MCCVNMVNMVGEYMLCEYDVGCEYGEYGEYGRYGGYGGYSGYIGYVE